MCPNDTDDNQGNNIIGSTKFQLQLAHTEYFTLECKL